MGKTTFYQKNFTGWPPIPNSEHKNSDSYYWQTRTQDMKFWLIENMGEGAFVEWVDQVFPDDNIEQSSWKEIFECYEAKFRECKEIDRLKDSCGCVLPEHSCWACEELKKYNNKGDDVE